MLRSLWDAFGMHNCVSEGNGAFLYCEQMYTNSQWDTIQIQVISVLHHTDLLVASPLTPPHLVVLSYRSSLQEGPPQCPPYIVHSIVTSFDGPSSVVSCDVVLLLSDLLDLLGVGITSGSSPPHG